MVRQSDAGRRIPLSRDRVLRAAVALADDAGIESLNIRRLAQELGVVPMALYKHVANKDELIDGMVDVVVGEMDPPVPQWARAGPLTWRPAGSSRLGDRPADRKVYGVHCRCGEN